MFLSACSAMELALKEDKIRYTVVNNEHDGICSADYTIMIGSVEGLITLYEDGAGLAVIFSDDQGDGGDYEDSESIDELEEWDPSSGLSNLIEHINTRIKVEAKISDLLDKIKNICDKYGVDMSNYVSVNKEI